MTDFDFIEIGTSNFDTLCQAATAHQLGISVEAVSSYLEALPNKPNVIKVHAAITANRTSESVDVYYIPEAVIVEKNLLWWLKGCNSINKPHPLHAGHIEDVVKDTVPLLNIEELLRTHDVKSIQFLKIDTEGHDCIIMQGLFDYLEGVKDTIFRPRKILFESNSNTTIEDVDAVIARGAGLGYIVTLRGLDTMLEFVS